MTRPYLLFVGLGDPRKRTIDVIRALSHLPGVNAVLVGEDTRGLGAALIREAARTGVQDRVDMPGYVDSDELRRLYAGALALV